MACAPVVLVEGMSDGFLPTPADINMALDGYDRRRYLKLRSSLHRNRLVYGRLLLRTSLSRVTGGRIAPEQWRFTRTPLGKPVLAPVRMPFDLSFSLSYSGPLIAVAISEVGSIGMDIELLDSREMPDISSALSNAEQSFIADLPPEKKYPALMRIWTLKEAFAKMVGLGFVLDFATLTIVSTSPPSISFSASCAVRPGNFSLQCREISVQGHCCILSIAQAGRHALTVDIQEKEK